MQKKVVSAKNKKAPKKGASNIKNKQTPLDDVFLGVEEAPKIEKVRKINKKKLKQIKKQKTKEKRKISKEIKKQEKLEEKQRAKRRKKLNPKQIKKREKNKKIFTYLFLFILLIVAFSLFLLSPIFNIAKIEVNGNEQVSSDEIISLSTLQKGINLFRVNKGQTIQAIKENAFIDKVQIIRKLPGTIEIKVTERYPEYFLEIGGSYAYIDNKGYILELSTEKLEGKVKIQGYKTKQEDLRPGNRICEEDVQELDAIRVILSTTEHFNLRELISSINIEDNTNYILYIEPKNKTVVLGDITDLDTKLLYLQSIINKEEDRPETIFLNVDYRKQHPYGRYT